MSGAQPCVREALSRAQARQVAALERFDEALRELRIADLGLAEAERRVREARA